MSCAPAVDLLRTHYATASISGGVRSQAGVVEPHGRVLAALAGDLASE
jgi:hypothetical protein